MKKIFYLLFVFPLLFSCGGENDASSDVALNENIHKDSIQNTLGAQNMILNTCDYDYALDTYCKSAGFEDIEIQERNILKIEVNSQNQITVRNALSDPSKISEIIMEFYTHCEKENDFASNYPVYSTATLELCRERMAAVDGQIDEADATGNKDLVTYWSFVWDEWAKKISALELLTAQTGLTELREIDRHAQMVLIIQNGVKKELISSIYSEIKECILNLRNKKSIELFDKSYVYYRNSNNPEHKIHCDLIELSYPLRIGVFDSEGNEYNYKDSGKFIIKPKISSARFKAYIKSYTR